MLRSARDLKNYGIVTGDDEVGRIADLLFDDERWTVRYLVADTGGWLTGRQVLISPRAIAGVDDDILRVNLSLTREQVQKAPGLATDLPVSRQYEIEYNRYYGWPDYWVGENLWGPGPYPAWAPPTGRIPAAYAGYPPPAMQPEPVPQPAPDTGDRHLRSMNEVTHYGILARDGKFGRMEDFLLEDSDWSIQNLVVDTTLGFGGEVLVAVGSVEEVDWPNRKLVVNLNRDDVRNGPPVDLSRFTHRT
jgi:hypothetical protein